MPSRQFTLLVKRGREKGKRIKKKERKREDETRETRRSYVKHNQYFHVQLPLDNLDYTRWHYADESKTVWSNISPFDASFQASPLSFVDLREFVVPMLYNGNGNLVELNKQSNTNVVKKLSNWMKKKIIHNRANKFVYK